MKKTTSILLAIVLGFSGFCAGADGLRQSSRKMAERRRDRPEKGNGLANGGGAFLAEGGDQHRRRRSGFRCSIDRQLQTEKFGEIDFKNGAATLKVESGVEAQSDGKSISTPIDLVSDEKGKPTEIRTGSQTFYLIKREDRFGIRLKDSKSKARLAFKGQHWFPIDESYKVTSRLEAFPEPKELMVPNVLGGHFKMKSPGILKFTLKGKECSLQPVEEEDGSLFIIFGDKSNLNETYKSGRFLHADKAVNGEAVLDFNKAENPPCAFTPFATCPLPPPGNSLEVEIKAGEKRYDH